MILIICAWIYYFLLALSIGAGFLKLISRITGPSVNLSFGIFYQFWFGFCVLIGLLQLTSLVLPVNKTTFIIISLLAIVFAAINIKSAHARLMLIYQWLTTPKGFLSFLAVCFMLAFVSYSANREVQHADTFLYHFNGVRWAKEYPAVPGLANLHGRLGFNSSFFLFAALTDLGIYTDQSTHIALSLLMVICLVHWFFIISNPKELMSKRIFCLLTTLFLVDHIISQIDITSLSTDYPMAVLTMIFCIVLLDKLNHKILLLLPLAAVIFSFKLSGMLTIGTGLVILAGYIVLFKYGNNDRRSRKAELSIFTISFALLCFIVSGFMIRNVIVSGWLIYPFPIGNLHLPWSVPRPYVLDMIAWIKSYPKIPGGASPTTINEHPSFFWIPQWFSQFRLSREFNLLCVSIFILLWSAFQIPSFSKFIYARLNVLLLVLFAGVSTLFWFVSAPELRFGSVYFFIFFASAVIFLYEGSRYKDILKIFIYALFMYQIADRVPSYVLIDKAPNLFRFAYTKPRELVRVVGSPPNEKPALYIYMPAQGDACGNSPLPCTPYAGGFLHNHRLIKQRVPGDLSKGFLPTE